MPEKILVLLLLGLIQFLVIILPSINFPMPGFSDYQLTVVEFGLVSMMFLIIFFL